MWGEHRWPHQLDNQTGRHNGLSDVSYPRWAPHMLAPGWKQLPPKRQAPLPPALSLRSSSISSFGIELLGTEQVGQCIKRREMRHMAHGVRRCVATGSCPFVRHSIKLRLPKAVQPSSVPIAKSGTEKKHHTFAGAASRAFDTSACAGLCSCVPMAYTPRLKWCLQNWWNTIYINQGSATGNMLVGSRLLANHSSSASSPSCAGGAAGDAARSMAGSAAVASS